MQMNRKKFALVCENMAGLYVERRIQRTAAALSYFLTLSVFPMLICLYTMLGSFFPAGAELREMLSGLLPESTVDTVVEYMSYISENLSNTMLAMALATVVTSASAAFRTISDALGEMRGLRRHGGAAGPLLGVVSSLIFLTAVYMAVILIVTGRWFLRFLDRHIMFMNISSNWAWGRFVLLFLLLFVLLSTLYRVSAPRRGAVRILPGALLGSLALLIVSFVFSAVIGVSSKYPLVYGSLASSIIIMFWLYVCGVVLLMGNALNVSLERADAH